MKYVKQTCNTGHKRSDKLESLKTVLKLTNDNKKRADDAETERLWGDCGPTELMTGGESISLGRNIYREE